MIKYNNEKCTAKEMVTQILEEKICDAREYWYEDSSVSYDKMTEPEKERVRDQFRKLGVRLIKKLGLEPSEWWSQDL